MDLASWITWMASPWMETTELVVTQQVKCQVYRPPSKKTNSFLSSSQMGDGVRHRQTGISWSYGRVNWLRQKVMNANLDTDLAYFSVAIKIISFYHIRIPTENLFPLWNTCSMQFARHIVCSLCPLPEVYDTHIVSSYVIKQNVGDLGSMRKSCKSYKCLVHYIKIQACTTSTYMIIRDLFFQWYQMINYHFNVIKR